MTHASTAIDVSMGQWKIEDLAPQGQTITLETHSVVTCVALGGIDPVSKTAFLTHLAYHETDIEKTKLEAKQILEDIKKALEARHLKLDNFQLAITGASQFPESELETLRKNEFGTFIKEHMKEKFEIQDYTFQRFGGPMDRSVTISLADGIRVKQRRLESQSW